MEASANAKLAVVDASQQIEERDREISRLAELFENKSKIVRV
jgi:hypothetical protein